MSKIHIDTTSEKDAVRLTFSAPTEREVLTDALHSVLHLLRANCKMGTVDSKQFNSLVQTACELEDEIQRMLQENSVNHLQELGVKVVDYPTPPHIQHRKSYEPAPIPTAGVSTPTSAPTTQSADAQSFRDSITEISRLIIADSHIPDFNQQVFCRYKATDFMKSMEECLEYLMKEYTKRPDGKLIVGFGYSVAYYALLLLLQRHHAKDPIRNIPAFSMAIMNRIVELLVKKNHDYGNSFGNQLANHGPIVFKIRMEDKIYRLRTLLTTDAQVKDESIEDTLRDIIGYCILFIHHYTK